MLSLLLAGALSLPLLPDESLTPGAILTTDTKTVCTPGYAGSVRHVTQSTKNKIFAEYGIKPSGDFEIDHLISLQLGGSNDESNLWPQSYTTMPYNAHVKDVLESYLHHLVCKGKMTLQDAQEAIRGNWINTYRKIVETK